MKTVTIPMITATVGGLACAGLGLATGPRARAAQAAILQPHHVAVRCSGRHGTVGSANAYGLTLNFSAVRNDPGKSYDTLTPGDTFKVFRVTMRNHGTVTYGYSRDDFSLLDARARDWSLGGDSNLGTALDYGGKLGPGSTIVGEVAAPMPVGVQPVAVHWQPSHIGNNYHAAGRIVVLPAGTPGMASCPAGQPRPTGPVGRVTLDGVTVSVGAPRIAHGNNTSNLTPGDVYKVVQVTIHNGGTVTYNRGSGDFRLLDGQAGDYAEVSNSDLSNDLYSVSDVKPGSTIVADAAFEMPPNVQPVALRWHPDEIGHDSKLTTQIIMLHR